MKVLNFQDKSFRRPWAHEELSPRFTFSLRRPNHGRNKTHGRRTIFFLPIIFPEGVAKHGTPDRFRGKMETKPGFFYVQNLSFFQAPTLTVGTKVAMVYHSRLGTHSIRRSGCLLPRCYLGETAIQSQTTGTQTIKLSVDHYALGTPPPVKVYKDFLLKIFVVRSSPRGDCYWARGQSIIITRHNPVMLVSQSEGYFSCQAQWKQRSVCVRCSTRTVEDQQIQRTRRWSFETAICDVERAVRG